jgi:hypothetical protein
MSVQSRPTSTPNGSAPAWRRITKSKLGALLLRAVPDDPPVVEVRATEAPIEVFRRGTASRATRALL